MRRRMEERLKVLKTWHQSNFFQLDMFWQLTGEASYYEEIEGEISSSLVESQVSEAFEEHSVLNSSTRILAWSFLCDTEVGHTVGR